MSQFIIEGGLKLRGEIIPQGAKNEALQIIPATVLYCGATTIHNMPYILDVINLLKLLTDAGAVVTWSDNADSEGKTFCKSVTIDNTHLRGEYFVSQEFVESSKKLRGSITLLGPVLARFGSCIVPKPGGDKIGKRPIDTHLLGLRELGVMYRVDKQRDVIFAEASSIGVNHFILDEASVTGTANIIMAACGRLDYGDTPTTIYNAACEPYVQQLCKYLNTLGADIRGVGTNLVHIYRGIVTHKEEQKDIAEHTLLPDFVEVASFMSLAILTNSLITIKHVRIDMLGNTLVPFRKIGANFEVVGDDIVMHDNSCYVIKDGDSGNVPIIYDQPWPMISPDLISVILTAAIQAKGTVMIHQRMFESRLHFVDRLQKMGAQIILCDPHRAVVVGLSRSKPLTGSVMESPDIRAGMSLLIAALSAEGETAVQNIEQIDRGYESIDQRLATLGANITRR